MQPTSIEAKEQMAKVLSEALNMNATDLPASLFFEIVEQIPVAISIADVDAKILYSNPTFEKLSGYSAKELLHQKHSILSYKKTPKEVYESLWYTLLAGKRWDGTLLNKRKDGSPYLADLTVSPVFNSDHEVVYYLGIHHDVTENMELERKLKNQKSLLETVIDDAPIVICVLNEKGKVLVENHGYKVLTADLDGKEPSKFFLQAVSEAIGESFDELKKKKRNFDTIEVRLELAGAHHPKWFSCSGTWISDVKVGVDHYYDEEKSNDLLLICNDITKRRYHFEQAKTNAIKALMAEKQMVQGIHEVLSGAIYQLQGPLNLITAASSMLDRGVSDPLTLKTMLRQVQESGAQALCKLKACLPHVATEAITPLNLNELVREVLDITTEKFLSEGIIVNWRPEPIVPSIIGQAHALRSMFKHLLDNAICAMNEPGARAREITVQTKVVDDHVVNLIISDTGPGIEDSLKHKVFEPFYTNWKKAKGKSGMGLAIVQQVASEHNASVEISETFEGGTRVSVSLPSGDD